MKNLDISFGVYYEKLTCGNNNAYRFTMPSKGTIGLKLNIETLSYVFVHLYSMNAASFYPSDRKLNSGIFIHDNLIYPGNNSKIDGTLYYSLSAGTYFVVFRSGFPADSVISFSVSFNTLSEDMKIFS